MNNESAKDRAYVYEVLEELTLKLRSGGKNATNTSTS